MINHDKEPLKIKKAVIFYYVMIKKLLRISDLEKVFFVFLIFSIFEWKLFGIILENNKKGFDIQNGEEWASVLYTSGLKEMNYVGGAAVRKLIVGTEGKIEDMQILTTNESPPSEPIPFHHELA